MESETKQVNKATSTDTSRTLLTLKQNQIGNKATRFLTLELQKQIRSSPKPASFELAASFRVTDTEPPRIVPSEKFCV